MRAIPMVDMPVRIIFYLPLTLKFFLFFARFNFSLLSLRKLMNVFRPRYKYVTRSFVPSLRTMKYEWWAGGLLIAIVGVN